MHNGMRSSETMHNIYKQKSLRYSQASSRGTYFQEFPFLIMYNMHHIHDGFSNHFTYYLLDSVSVQLHQMNIYKLTLHRNTTIHFAIV